jgi:RNA polymerase subunit RPABC4/transcription elongation factor Spt4
MIQCQNCGQVNNQSSNFCRFCGTKFASEQLQNGGFEFAPPRPYAWKTDEFQINESKAKRTQQMNFKQINQVQPLGVPPQFSQQQYAPQQQALAYQQPQNLAHKMSCPRCGGQHFPRFERKISTAGWIVFAVLLVTFFPLFWIGFLIKEDVRVCPVCNLKFD